MRTQRSNYEKNKKHKGLKINITVVMYFTIHAINYLSFFRKIFYALLYINLYLQRHTDFVQMSGYSTGSVIFW